MHRPAQHQCAGTHVTSTCPSRRRLCQALADSGPLEHQLLYRQQLEELEPLIRFCQYEQGRGGAAPAPAVPEQELSEQLQARALLWVCGMHDL